MWHPILNLGWPHFQVLNLIISARILLKSKVTFTGCRGENIDTAFSLPRPLHPPQPRVYFPPLWIRLPWTFLRDGVIEHVVLCNCLLSPNVGLPRFCVVVCTGTFLGCRRIVLCMDVPQLSDPFITTETQESFLFLALLKNVAMKIHAQALTAVRH